ncbi:hydrolase [soil metagenome]
MTRLPSGPRLMARGLIVALLGATVLAGTAAADEAFELIEYPVPAGSRPHDVAPALDGGVWYTGQGDGTLGLLDPTSGEVTVIPLGRGSRPHGVIVGPDGAPWVTDSGLNAIVRVDPATHAVTTYPLPDDRPGANLNTATFDGEGVLWFTGQSGVYGRLDPADGVMQVFDAPGGRGPYGIATTPDGEVWYASLAGSHIATIDRETGAAAPVQPPTPDQGARRVWSDSAGRLWVAEWEVGQVGRYDPAADAWEEWRLPGERPMAYAVYVDDQDAVWLTDFGANAIVRFDPGTEEFTPVPLPDPGASVRQLLGRPGEVWGAESGLDRLVVIRMVDDHE